MSIAVLGGSFDPPHIGHYFVIEQIREIRKNINQILLMPAYEHQWKPIQASAEHRFNMLHYLESEKVTISDMEMQRRGGKYTIDTLLELKRLQPNDTFYFIVGSDILSEWERWEKTEQLLSLATFLVFPRDPHRLPETIPQGFEVVADKNLITTNISSTIIRERVKKGKSITHLVPIGVEQYIMEHNLYR
ncbi:MAG: nicotinate (nicotinamide) nucleotide adenylyltransferase [Candidatus Levybacteria bacterium]|nr:nicotinate (nicotinamide) nucleotide adenylyltransferase [Candidatus Levybacteria bacterium]